MATPLVTREKSVLQSALLVVDQVVHHNGTKFSQIICKSLRLSIGFLKFLGIFPTVMEHLSHKSAPLKEPNPLARRTGDSWMFSYYYPDDVRIAIDRMLEAFDS